MPTLAGCQAVTNALSYETGRIGPELFRRSVRERPIIGLMSETRGTWQHGMGVTVSNMTFERSMSTSTTNPWVAVSPSDGASVNACLPAVTQVTFGQTQRTMTPETFALETQYFCIRDILFDWQFAKNLEAIKGMLAKRSSWEWARKFTQDYYGVAGHNLTTRTTGIVDNGTAGYDTAN